MSIKPRSLPPLQRVRRIIDELPETFERESHGAPTWWGGKKTFATYHDGHYDDGQPSVWFKGPPGMQEALVGADPAQFFRPKYLGPSGWVGVRLRPHTDWAEVEALLVQAYRLVAPRRALARLDGDGNAT